jgi:hypothetical protein
MHAGGSVILHPAFRVQLLSGVIVPVEREQHPRAAVARNDRFRLGEHVGILIVDRRIDAVVLEGDERPSGRPRGLLGQAAHRLGRAMAHVVLIPRVSEAVEAVALHLVQAGPVPECREQGFGGRAVVVAGNDDVRHLPGQVPQDGSQLRKVGRRPRRAAVVDQVSQHGHRVEAAVPARVDDGALDQFRPEPKGHAIHLGSPAGLGCEVNVAKD